VTGPTTRPGPVPPSRPPADPPPGDDGGPPLAELLALAVELGEAAAALLVAACAPGAPRLVATDKSSPTDHVTAADRASERLIVEGIRRARPDDAILGEEGASQAGTSGLRWVIDPLDGTTNLLYGLPAYAVSIAVERAGRPVVGVVVDAARSETFTATLGGGAWMDGARLGCGRVDDLGLALVGTGFSYEAARRGHQGAVVAGLLPRVRDLRRVGAAALDLCWVACGRLDAFYEGGLQPWDRAAGALVAREAGAEVTDLAGGDPSGELTVAANPALAGSLRAALDELGAGRHW
jgi:fructose-1,6-bisphosphatase/inositol monophosphatase family enzyme